MSLKNGSLGLKDYFYRKDDICFLLFAFIILSQPQIVTIYIIIIYIQQFRRTVILARSQGVWL